jgi:adenylate kinase
MFYKNVWFLVAASLVLPGCNFSSKDEKTTVDSTTTQTEGKQMEKTIFSFFGAPGSGKGTLAERCIEKLNFKVLSTGNLCRAAMNKDDEKSKLITSILKTGKLVPDELITDMVEEWLEKETSDNKTIILDGYPRTAKQAELLLKLLDTKFKDYKFRVISMLVPEEEIVDRIINRVICENKICQITYSLKLLKDPNNLVCEKCGSKLIRRQDDSEQVVRERLSVYAKYSEDVLNFYKNKNINVEELNASKLSVDDVFDAFQKML